MPEAHWVSLHLASRGISVLSLDYRKALHGVRYPAHRMTFLPGGFGPLSTLVSSVWRLRTTFTWVGPAPGLHWLPRSRDASGMAPGRCRRQCCSPILLSMHSFLRSVRNLPRGSKASRRALFSHRSSSVK
ncbi:hypothetical protein AHiyo6_36820 [Arthrobacter sp. Hiyo6]|nr:hypothetical protein AHiyo6_36820 [Arthrobacter sp. Hiyo6]